MNRSRKWIDPTYRKYQEYCSEVKIEKSDSPSKPERRRSPKDENDEDSIDMELSTSFKDRDCYMARFLDPDIKDDIMDVS